MVEQDHGHRGRSRRGSSAAPPAQPGWWYYCWSVVLVLVALGAHGAICAGHHFSGSGRWVDLSIETIRAAMTRPPGQMFLRPLSILTHPWMIGVHGLVLGGMIFAPAVIAARYGLAVSAAFVLPVLLLAHSPAVALAVTAGVVLTARSSIRRDHPSLAAILGVLPAAAYLLVAGISAMRSAAIMPIQRWLPLVPALLAVGVAAASVGLAGLLSHVPGLRRGAVALVALFLLTGGLVTFDRNVGTDELDYALIVDGLKPGEALFEPVALERWKRAHGGEGLNPQTLLNGVQSWLKARRSEVAGRAERFVQEHPDSRRTPEVMWIRAQCACVQLDEHALADGLVKPVGSWPREESAPLWRALRDRRPATPQGALASWRLGELALRAREAAAGEQRLHDAAQRLEKGLETGSSGEDESFFLPQASIPTRAYQAEALSRIRRLRWLVLSNDVMDDPNAAAALADYLALNPYRRGYLQELRALAGRYAETSFAANLRVAVARATRDIHARAEILIEVAEGWRKDADASIEANYELGRLVMEEPVLRLKSKVKAAEEYFRLVADEADPDNPWKEFASRRLNWLKRKPGRPAD